MMLIIEELHVAITTLMSHYAISSLLFTLTFIFIISSLHYADAAYIYAIIITRYCFHYLPSLLTHVSFTFFIAHWRTALAR